MLSQKIVALVQFLPVTRSATLLLSISVFSYFLFFSWTTSALFTKQTKFSCDEMASSRKYSKFFSPGKQVKKFFSSKIALVAIPPPNHQKLFSQKPLKTVWASTSILHPCYLSWMVGRGFILLSTQRFSTLHFGTRKVFFRLAKVQLISLAKFTYRDSSKSSKLTDHLTFKKFELKEITIFSKVAKEIPLLRQKEVGEISQ